MCPGYKPINSVGHLGTPISTPVMQHSISENHLQLPYVEFANPSSRMSGMFSGSSLSLTGNMEQISSEDVITENDIAQQNGSSQSTSTQINSREIVTSSESVNLPPRPLSSSEILETEIDSDVHLLRRVSSDTSTPKNQRKIISLTNPVETKRPSSLESSNSVIGSQSVTSVDSDTTITPGNSRPPSTERYILDESSSV